MPVLQAADRKAVRLSVGIPVDRGVGGIQIAIPSISTALRRRPEVRVRASIVETAIGIAVAG